MVYFQNFNKAGSPNLWYRLRANALRTLRESDEEAFVCLTSPAENLVYQLPVSQILDRAKRSGWSEDEDLEVNIDHANARWRELDWQIEPNLIRLS